MVEISYSLLVVTPFDQARQVEPELGLFVARPGGSMEGVAGRGKRRQGPAPIR